MNHRAHPLLFDVLTRLLDSNLFNKRINLYYISKLLCVCVCEKMNHKSNHYLDWKPLL